jgi:hypothetical protein
MPKQRGATERQGTLPANAMGLGYVLIGDLGPIKAVTVGRDLGTRQWVFLTIWALFTQ